VRQLLAIVAACAAFAGCGGDGGGNASLVLRETAASLGKIKSAKPLHLRLAVDPRDGDEFGFEIEGPFALCDHRPLPRLDVDYTQFAQGEEATVHLISTGEDSFVEVDGETYELPNEQEAELHNSCGEVEGGFEELRVDDWVTDADADGNRVTGELDVAAVVNDLSDVARAFGRSEIAQLDADDRRRLADAVRESSFELERGDDGLLRHLLLEADVAFDVPDDLRDALGDLVGARITFELDLDEPNTPVEISAPKNPRPADELPGAKR
jgi:hypothetical protein